MKGSKLSYFEDEDILHLVISEEEEANSLELSPNITAELNEKGEFIGTELLNASRVVQETFVEGVQAETLRMLPTDIPEIQLYPNVSNFVKNHLSMQFGDVRSMLRLPLREFGVKDGCNFAVAAILCNLISGISVSLFMPPNPIWTDREGKTNWIGPGVAFKQLLRNFYPWEPGDNKTKRGQALYHYFRNPLAHALGVERKLAYKIQIKKSSLRNEQIWEMETSPTRPNWLPPGLSELGKNLTLNAAGFYRDVFHMFWNLARDERQMSGAEKRFSKGNFIWREGKPPRAEL